ncbi:MAG: hypothetical protein U9Q92_02595 [archaeon]|nr:hypothetical protein [archaeon]
MGVEITQLMMTVGALMVVLILLVFSTKAVVELTDEDVQLITEQTTRAMSSILINIASMEQGVRHYDLKKNFAYDLDSTHIRLTYVGKTHTLRDSIGREHSFAVRHYQENIIPRSNIEGSQRICISKKIVNCEPQITICEEEEPCCTIDKSSCKYIQHK